MENTPALSLPLVNQLIALVAPQAAAPVMLDLAARLAPHGPLFVIDSGNQFNALIVARLLRRHTADLDNALRRISLSRAFTCYQVHALLLDTHIQDRPVLVLDFLSTFYDESVPYEESRHLLRRCLGLLRRLSRSAPVVAAAHPPGAACQERLPMIDLFTQAAATVLVHQESPNAPVTRRKKIWDGPCLPLP
jgi:hypothetical protein